MTAFLGLFNEARSHVVEYDGAPLYSMYFLELSKPSRIVLRWESSVLEPVQGLVLRSRDGHLATAGQRAKSLVLWADTSPSEVTLECEPTRGTMRVALYNCWRADDGGVQSSLGCAAMRVDDEGDGLLLRASDWTSPPSFGDLVLRVRVDG